jgi:hypothetical protein
MYALVEFTAMGKLNFALIQWRQRYDEDRIVGCDRNRLAFAPDAPAITIKAPVLPRLFLNASNELVLFAFDESQLISGQLGQLLFDPAFRDIPTSFRFESIHRCLWRQRIPCKCRAGWGK